MNRSAASGNNRPRSRQLQRGSLAGPDMIITLVIIAVVAVFVLPPLIKHAVFRQNACVSNLGQIAAGMISDLPECPVEGDPYIKTDTENGFTVRCPHPENHLLFDLHAVRQGPDWYFKQNIVSGGRPDEPETISGDGFEIKWDPAAQTAVCIKKLNGIGWMIFGGVLALLGLVFLTAFVFLIVLLAREWQENSIGPLFLYIVLIGLCGWGTVSIFFGKKYVIVDHAAGTVIVESRYSKPRPGSGDPLQNPLGIIALKDSRAKLNVYSLNNDGDNIGFELICSPSSEQLPEIMGLLVPDKPAAASPAPE